MQYDEVPKLLYRFPDIGIRTAIGYFEMQKREKAQVYADDFLLPSVPDSQIVCIDNYFLPFNCPDSIVKSLGLVGRNDRRIVWLHPASLKPRSSRKLYGIISR